MNAVAVFLVSAAPAAAFLVYILWMDRREPEPAGLIVRAFLLGAVSCFPAMLVEMAAERLTFIRWGGMWGVIQESFFQVAPVEEACKLLVVVLFIWKSGQFNEENDGIVYVGTAALGFAFLENLFYVAQEGLGVGVLRAFTSVPLHVATGIVLGYHAGLARFSSSAAAGRRQILKGFVIAWLMHGVYDSFALSESAAALLVIPLVAGVSVFAGIHVGRGRRLSLARWGEGKTDTAADAASVLPRSGVTDAGPRIRRAVPGSPSRVPIVVSRTLFALVLLFWGLMYAGLMTPESEGGERDAVLGGVVITFLPILLGVFLEISHARNRRKVSGA